MQCKKCKYWERQQGVIGECNSDMFVYSGDMGLNDEYESNRLYYWDSECWSAGFKTGEDFGCIHYKEESP